MCFDLKCFYGSEAERNHLPYKEQFFSLSQFALQVLITIGIIALIFSFVLARNCLSLHFHLGGNGEFKPSKLLCFPWIFSSRLAVAGYASLSADWKQFSNSDVSPPFHTCAKLFILLPTAMQET